MKKTLALLTLLSAASPSPASAQSNKNFISNPIVSGYFADPTIVKDKDTFYIYATIDPWGADELAVLETKDFKTFNRKTLNWPTKQACTSPTSGDAKVWAPGVVKAPNGKYYMYVAVGSEIWAGVSDAPLGPWKNMKADNTPLVSQTDFPKVHNIDADCFIDDDGQAYLYWGSGYNWKNGRCMVVKLNKDMVTFAETPRDVTPPTFFEGAHMIKRNKKYYLMFSSGKAVDASYRVGYAIGDTPYGPFKELGDNPILSTTADSTVIGPGHHTVLREGGQDYIVYHRLTPNKEKAVLRQLCIDYLNYNPDGSIKKITPAGVKPFINTKASVK
ncbi:MAG: family 43 glycosylhydrolase [Arcticibacter sp.]